MVEFADFSRYIHGCIMDAKHIIETLGLTAHPEGGYYSETYRSRINLAKAALPDEYTGPRAISTAIYFLLTGDTFSAFHRLRSDELWHHYTGDPIHVYFIYPDGRHECIVVGCDLAAGQRPQVVIPAHCWFAAEVKRKDGYALFGCTVAPGFDFNDFELARRESLIQQFPRQAEIITTFTREQP